ncbi:MAG TPA: A/G-specific adenine glycosylase [Thermoanaerobaculia bacterium]|nr:A/G-specific adenine glycosylase [Thermoanaerobaculia bacterium]
MPVSATRKFAQRIERWFARHQRPLPWRETYDPWLVWVSEVMLQQTRMEVVLGYYARFIERFPTVASLAAASPDEVTAAWSGLGYYRRARMLRDGAIDVMRRFDGRVPDTVDELLTIPGIGRYTAGAIASIAHRRKAPIVDGNITRILARVFGVEDAWTHAQSLVDASRDPRALNQGVMELGALVCKPRHPLCLVCPLAADCVARATGRIDELPRRKEKTATRALRIPLFLITDRRGRVLMRRESGKLMTAMFHLPHGDTSLLPATPLAAEPSTLLGTFRHTITNRRIEFALYAAKLSSRAGREYSWIDPNELASVPHPSYVKKAIALVGRICECAGV